MPEHQIHWTALPRGADGTHVELDVFVSPRLGTDAQATEYSLDEFPELATWTARVAAGEVSFEVAFEGEAAVPAAIVAQDPLDKDLWRHLFPAGSLVAPWSFRDHSARPIRSFPVRWLLAYLRELYKQVGGPSGAEMPGAEDLEQLRKDAGGIIDTRVPEEREPATERPNPNAPRPHEQPQGCLTAIFGPLCRWLRKLLGLGGAGSSSGAPKPGRPVPGSVLFPYRPPAPRPSDPYGEIDAEIATYGAVRPVPPADEKSSKRSRATRSPPPSRRRSSSMTAPSRGRSRWSTPTSTWCRHRRRSRAGTSIAGSERSATTRALHAPTRIVVRSASGRHGPQPRQGPSGPCRALAASRGRPSTSRRPPLASWRGSASTPNLGQGLTSSRGCST